MRPPVPAIAALLLSLGRALAIDAPDFNREVRPILSNYCFQCHGPDDKTRKARLRLDLPEEALKPAKSGDRAIVPSHLEESQLITRILSEDEDDVMPPPSVKKVMTPAQKEVLQRWVASGAKYDRHWAFVPPQPQTIPGPAGQHPIDAFVRARLVREGLQASPEAARATLIRRVSLDLIGLPPTPEEADAFAADTTPGAYERLVDRLLASPHYGERWARRWLDLARYADTNGYEKDRERSMWPWRDWVIRALNADMPFDQFTIEQLAGDLLPGATRDQLVATGFHRNTMLNEEGGIDPLEYRFHAMTDRVATTGTTWLGLTVGCAQCHTHKFDPIQHREYFQMMAFLNNADEPHLELASEDLAAKQAAHREKLTALLTEKLPPSTVPWTTLRPAKATSNLPLLTVQEDGSVFASGDITKSDTYDLEFESLPAGVQAIRLEALPDDRLPRHGPGMAYYEGPQGDFFLGEIEARIDGRPVKFGPATESYGKSGLGGNTASAALATDGDPQTGWSASGLEGQASEAVFQLAEPLPAAKSLNIRLRFGRHYACSLGRLRISITTAPGAEAVPLSKELVSELAKLRQAEPKPPITLIMRERPPENPRATFLHNRGEFLQPTEKVEPGVFSFLPPLQAEKKDRLAFARWLVSPEHPLTSRVTVNRQWAAFFGRGLVRTTDDFGYQGETPSHPELLDWLAREFIAQGWSLKKLHRLIVTSATYRQDSRGTPELLAKDGENKWLARGPRGRLEAEMIRDATLRAAGLLAEKVGGPSVFPPQPEGVSEVAYGNPKWTTSAGEDRYRRGLYTFARRTAPYAMFATFDAPAGDACIARRDVSNSPLQALSLLNNMVIVEAAQALGTRLAALPGEPDARIQELFRRCLSRAPTTTEATLAKNFFEVQKQRCEAGELDAKALAGNGPGDAVAQAAWTALARAVLNLDEAITKR